MRHTITIATRKKVTALAVAPVLMVGALIGLTGLPASAAQAKDSPAAPHRQVSPEDTICYTTWSGDSATSICFGTDEWYQVINCELGLVLFSKTIIGTGGTTQTCQLGLGVVSARVEFVGGGVA